MRRAERAGGEHEAIGFDRDALAGVLDRWTCSRAIRPCSRLEAQRDRARPQLHAALARAARIIIVATSFFASIAHAYVSQVRHATQALRLVARRVVDRERQVKRRQPDVDGGLDDALRDRRERGGR